MPRKYARRVLRKQSSTSRHLSSYTHTIYGPRKNLLLVYSKHYRYVIKNVRSSSETESSAVAYEDCGAEAWLSAAVVSCRLSDEIEPDDAFRLGVAAATAAVDTKLLLAGPSRTLEPLPEAAGHMLAASLAALPLVRVHERSALGRTYRPHRQYHPPT